MCIATQLDILKQEKNQKIHSVDILAQKPTLSSLGQMALEPTLPIA
jgi:hypothetical protein